MRSATTGFFSTFASTKSLMRHRSSQRLKNVAASLYGPGPCDTVKAVEMHPWRTVGRAIPRSGCSPAEPASVSPGGRDDTAKGQCGARPKVKDREGLGGTLIVAGGQAVGTSNCR